MIAVLLNRGLCAVVAPFVNGQQEGSQQPCLEGLKSRSPRRSEMKSGICKFCTIAPVVLATACATAAI